MILPVCWGSVINDFAKITEQGVVFAVRVTPKAHENKIAGWGHSDDGKFFLEVKLTAVPDKGSANQSLIKFLAKQLKLRQQQIKITSGTKSRLKMLEIKDNTGATLDQLKQM